MHVCIHEYSSGRVSTLNINSNLFAVDLPALWHDYQEVILRIRRRRAIYRLSQRRCRKSCERGVGGQVPKCWTGKEERMIYLFVYLFIFSFYFVLFHLGGKIEPYPLWQMKKRYELEGIFHVLWRYSFSFVPFRHRREYVFSSSIFSFSVFLSLSGQRRRGSSVGYFFSIFFQLFCFMFDLIPKKENKILSFSVPISWPSVRIHHAFIRLNY